MKKIYLLAKQNFYKIYRQIGKLIINNSNLEGGRYEKI